MNIMPPPNHAGLGVCPSMWGLEPVQGWPDARPTDNAADGRCFATCKVPPGRLAFAPSARPGSWTGSSTKKGEAHCWASPVVLLVEPPYGVPVRMVMVVVSAGGGEKLL